MTRLAIALLTVCAIAASMLSGCGGGGGNSKPTTPVDSGTRLLTGSVVSSSDGSGLAGVTVTLGDAVAKATTDAKGVFKISISSTATMPNYIQVDTSGAGSDYPSGNVVGFNGQSFRPDAISIPIEVLNGRDTLGTITAYNITGGVPPPPYASKDTILTGRILSAKTGNPISGANVLFGSSSIFTATSGANGYFAINIGLDITVLSIYPSATAAFSIDTSTAGSSWPNSLYVRLGGTTYAQSALVVPTDVLTGGSTDLGVITVVDDGSEDTPPTPPGGDDGGDTPPPPPIS